MRIFLFRGLLGAIFSRGMDTLGRKLAEQGHTISVHAFGSRRSVQRKCIEDYENGSDTSEIAVIGHSLGANRAIAMSNDLVKRGLPVRYLATVDPTIRRSVAGNVVADNFRSHDVRDRPIDGATEIRRNDLSHIQIDKDDKVHSRIITQCEATQTQFVHEPDNTGDAMTDEEYTRPGTGGPAHTSNQATAGLHDGGDDDLEKILALLLGAGDSGQALQGDDGDTDEIREVLELLRGTGGLEGDGNAVIPAVAAPPAVITPVNAALGLTIGKPLDGRKTGLGIIGLLATTILPVLFPEASPILNFLGTLGIGPEVVEGAKDAAGATKGTPNILTSLFYALTGWGVLGKVDKWVSGVQRPAA